MEKEEGRRPDAGLKEDRKKELREQILNLGFQNGWLVPRNDNPLVEEEEKPE